ncbi:hypothetical protein E2542_SST23015 [Spatholobus suberectus]|nr:hypothetical protein E2542_SST23015 [Spatholobus suberectus]
MLFLRRCGEGSVGRECGLIHLRTTVLALWFALRCGQDICKFKVVNQNPCLAAVAAFMRTEILVEGGGSSPQRDQGEGKETKKRSYNALQKKERNFAKHGDISEFMENRNPPLFTWFHLRQLC